MFLLVGLGNPGAKYARNRHNIGFMAVDAIHDRHRFQPWRSRFHAEIAEGVLGGARTLLMKPATYMNESGRAVGEAVRFLKIEPGAIVVIHDELDLPAAKLRMKTGGGHGGHNGLRSISAHIGEDYRRMRLGIGHPGSREAVHGYVLHDFAKADQDWLDPLMAAIAAEAPLLAKGEDATFANRVHLAAAPPKKPKKAAAAEPEQKPAATPAPERPEAGGALAHGLKKLFGRKE